MSRGFANYTRNGNSTSDEYGTFVTLNRSWVGDVVQGFLVVANGTPNMTVLVQPGSGRISTGTSPADYGYLVFHDTTAGESVTISTANTSPRIDYIVGYIDVSVTGSTSGSYVNNTNNVFKFAAVSGTPSGSPVVPTTSQIQSAIGSSNPYIILAQVYVGASVTSITNTNITDLRTFLANRNQRALGLASFIESGCVWSATSGLAAAMTAGTVQINVSGIFVPVTVAVISSRTFTASKDTYVYVDVTGTVGYLEVTNNAAAPTLPARSTWLAVVVTGSSTVSSVNMTGLGRILPGTIIGATCTDVAPVNATSGTVSNSTVTFTVPIACTLLATVCADQQRNVGDTQAITLTLDGTGVFGVTAKPRSTDLLVIGR